MLLDFRLLNPPKYSVRHLNLEPHLTLESSNIVPDCSSRLTMRLGIYPVQFRPEHNVVIEHGKLYLDSNNRLVFEDTVVAENFRLSPLHSYTQFSSVLPDNKITHIYLKAVTRTQYSYNGRGYFKSLKYSGKARAHFFDSTNAYLGFEEYTTFTLPQHQPQNIDDQSFHVLLPHTLPGSDYSYAILELLDDCYYTPKHSGIVFTNGYGKVYYVFSLEEGLKVLKDLATRIEPPRYISNVPDGATLAQDDGSNLNESLRYVAQTGGILKSGVAYELGLSILDLRTGEQSNVKLLQSFVMPADGYITIARSKGAIPDIPSRVNWFEYRFWYRALGTQEWLAAAQVPAAYFHYGNWTKLYTCNKPLAIGIGGTYGGFTDFSPLSEDNSHHSVITLKNILFIASSKAVYFANESDPFHFPAQCYAGFPYEVRALAKHTFYGQSEQTGRVIIFTSAATYAGYFTGDKMLVPVTVSPSVVGNFPQYGTDFFIEELTAFRGFAHQSSILADGTLFFAGEDGLVALPPNGAPVVLSKDVETWYKETFSSRAKTGCAYWDKENNNLYFLFQIGADTLGFVYNIEKQGIYPVSFQKKIIDSIDALGHIKYRATNNAKQMVARLKEGCGDWYPSSSSCLVAEKIDRTKITLTNYSAFPHAGDYVLLDSLDKLPCDGRYLVVEVNQSTREITVDVDTGVKAENILVPLFADRFCAFEAALNTQYFLLDENIRDIKYVYKATLHVQSETPRSQLMDISITGDFPRCITGVRSIMLAPKTKTHCIAGVYYRPEETSGLAVKLSLSGRMNGSRAIFDRLILDTSATTDTDMMFDEET